MARSPAAYFLSLLGLATTSLAWDKGCTVLAEKFPNKTSLPGTSEYKSEVSCNWSETCVFPAHCVFEPEDADDVAAAVRIVRETRSQCAVRGGGHMPVPRAAGTEDGVLISMSKLNSVSLSDDGNIAHIGSGLVWYDVYDELAQFNRTVAGGRFGPVGVGGLLVGGGISYFGSKVGWCANNVVNYEVVLADGSIVNANASSHADLSWALKGGSQNFGIVTRYDMKTFGIEDIWGGTITYPKSSVDGYLGAIASFVAPDGGSADALAAADPIMYVIPSTGEIRNVAVLFYKTPTSDPAPFENFTSIPTTESTAEVRDFMDFAEEQSGPDYSDSTKRRQFWVTALKATPEAVYLANSTFMESTKQLAHVPNFMTSITYQTVTKEWLEAARASGGDAIDLDPEDGGIIVVLIANTWDDPALDALSTYFCQDAVAAIEGAAKSAGLYHPWVNLNDAGRWQNPFATYGNGKSLPKMMDIRRKYDPSGVFQVLSPGGFKLGM